MNPDDRHPDDPDEGGETPVHGRVQHQQLSARVPEAVGPGEFSNGAIILRGGHETVIDFSLRLGEQQRVCSRIILTHRVASDFARALEENLTHYAARFGGSPTIPSMATEQPPAPDAPQDPGAVPREEPVAAGKPAGPGIEEIYDELKLVETTMVGRYANAVLIRHSATEFCFDFIANVYPRSVVTARIFMPAPHVPRLLDSLRHASQEPPPGSPPA